MPMRGLLKWAASWVAPTVCPGCEEGSGLVLNRVSGMFERCSLCSGDGSAAKAASNSSLTDIISPNVHKPLHAEDRKHD